MQKHTSVQPGRADGSTVVNDGSSGERGVGSFDAMMVDDTRGDVKVRARRVARLTRPPTPFGAPSRVGP